MNGAHFGSPRVVLVDIEPILSSVRMQRIQDTDNGIMSDVSLNARRRGSPGPLSKISATNGAADHFELVLTNNEGDTSVFAEAESTELKRPVRRSLRLSNLETMMQFNGTDHNDTENTIDGDAPNENLAGKSSTTKPTKGVKMESITTRYFQKVFTGNGVAEEKPTEKCKGAIMECSLCGFTCDYDGSQSTDPLLLHLRAHHNVLESKNLIDVSEIDTNIAEIDKRSTWKTHSIVWEFFTRGRDRSGKMVNVCVLCDFQSKPMNSAGTSAMLDHLRRNHNLVPFKNQFSAARR